MNMLKGISDLSSVGSRIKYYRLLNNLTQEDLSILSGLDRCTINRYENALVSHSLDLINKVSIALKINPLIIYDDYLEFISNDFGSKIKHIRKELTQQEFSKILNVHKYTIARWESETIAPTRYNFNKIMEIKNTY